jgi:SAM-dependent methyltransferase
MSEVVHTEFVTMALLRDRIRPALYDFFGQRMEKSFAEHRRKALASASGRVLEIGGGTGFNLPHYPGTIDELVVTEPNAGMLRRARRRAADRPMTFVQAAAESLPFEDSSFDTVVSTLVLCSVDDVDRALAEVHRVLRPGGQLIFVEHVRSSDPRTARWQDRLERPWHALADGCHPNRATLERLEAGPFELVDVERGELPKSPPIVRPLVAGRAIAR